MAVPALKKELNTLMSSVEGILAVLITDRDGVPLIEVHKDILPGLAVQASALSLTVMAADQVAKLGFGRCSSIGCNFENYQMVTFNKHPTSLLVTLIADSTTSMGMLLAMSSEFDTIVNELRRIKV